MPETSSIPATQTVVQAPCHASATHPWITIFTPVYNREKELPRLYEAIKKLRTKTSSGEEITFEWVIVNDGSTDGSHDLIKQWCADNELPIICLTQPNGGKHVAMNSGVANARGEMFLSIDSDDTLLPDTLIVFHENWYKIDEKERSGIKGVTGRCIDPETATIIGDPLPTNPLICSPQDLRFKYHVKGEMCGFNRLEIMKAHPFPTPDSCGRFFPESVVWFEIGKEYKEYVVDIPVREYYRDSGNAITSGGSANRAPQNYYLWEYEVNNLVLKYLTRSPKLMLKAIVGMSMDGFRTHRSVCTILKDCKGFTRKLLVATFMPAGWILSKRK